ncbi:hypothetical protein CHS0354_018909 [Potamilus streckersoni]|uniref:Uncharacterized protein n=1 Tax=Potamilus streckersoni TaxID=2493646 RepID=A0AAE0SC62_9BIVA|nr:hypothetical protein CHS0354_018909 [Potamilus streckersoni]
MLPFFHYKPLSASATTSPHKKTNFSQYERHLHEKLSSRNLSSRLKLKGPQHSQDVEGVASSISNSQGDARDIWIFEQPHRNGHNTSIISEGAKPSGHSVIHLNNRFLQTKNRQQRYVLMESEKNILETEENKLDNNHDDPDWIGNKKWYRILWRKFKKQAKNIVNSEADADSSFDEALSFDFHGTRRPSDSTWCNFKEHLWNENLAFQSLDGVEMSIENQKGDISHKIEPSVQACIILDSDFEYTNPLIPAVSSNSSILNQVPTTRDREQLVAKASSNTFEDIVPVARKILEKSVAKKKSSLKDSVPVARKILEKSVAKKKSSLKDSVPVARKILEKSVAKKKSSLKDSVSTTTRERREQFMVSTTTRERREQFMVPASRVRLNQLLAKGKSLLKDILPASRDRRKQLLAKGTLSNTLKEIVPVSRERLEKLQAKEKSSLKDSYIHQAEVDPDGQDEYLNKSPAHMHKNASAGERSKQESTPVKLYRNVMQNETCRMMTGIDMVVSEANRLFGNERTQIFFDLLDDELFNFGLSGAAPGFIPNMTQSTVRQHVISFFEHSCDTMNRLMTLLLGCPDRKLQQMPEQNFISLMQSVIGFSLKTTIKGGKRPTSKGSTFVMVDSEEFEKALGNEIPDNVLNRLSRGDEMVVHRFDTRLERTRDPQTRENRPILSIFFPSDRKIFIYIPTENGSYWHQADMQRASRICRNNK